MVLQIFTVSEVHLLFGDEAGLYGSQKKLHHHPIGSVLINEIGHVVHEFDAVHIIFAFHESMPNSGMYTFFHRGLLFVINR